MHIRSTGFLSLKASLCMLLPAILLVFSFAIVDNTVSMLCPMRYSKSALLEFDRERKSMSVIMTKKEDGSNILFCKGAGEVLVERCSHVMLKDGSIVPMTIDVQKAIVLHIEKMADKALRCLALAQKVRLQGPCLSYL